MKMKFKDLEARLSDSTRELTMHEQKMQGLQRELDERKQAVP